MTTQELREALLREHKRDVKLTFVNIGVIAFGALIILGLFIFLLVGTGVTISSFISQIIGNVDYASMGTYYQWIVPIIILSCIGSVAYSWYKTVNRPKEIEQFVRHIENGTRVTHLNEDKKYKVILPLIVVRYHTAPVKSFYVVLEGISKAFVFPVPFDCAEQVKDLLNENS